MKDTHEHKSKQQNNTYPTTREKTKTAPTEKRNLHKSPKCLCTFGYRKRIAVLCRWIFFIFSCGRMLLVDGRSELNRDAWSLFKRFGRAPSIQVKIYEFSSEWVRSPPNRCRIAVNRSRNWAHSEARSEAKCTGHRERMLAYRRFDSVRLENTTGNKYV